MLNAGSIFSNVSYYLVGLSFDLSLPPFQSNFHYVDCWPIPFLSQLWWASRLFFNEDDPKGNSYCCTVIFSASRQQHPWFHKTGKRCFGFYLFFRATTLFSHGAISTFICLAHTCRNSFWTSCLQHQSIFGDDSTTGNYVTIMLKESWVVVCLFVCLFS